MRAFGPAADVGAFEAQPASVQDVRVDDGSGPRSAVRSLTVTFNSPVAFAGDPAAALAPARIGGGAVAFTATVAAAGGRAVATLTAFAGPTRSSAPWLTAGTP